jgi:hypothetical protein
MPAYDWFKSSDFNTVIRTRIEQRLNEAGVQGMPYTFAGMLADIAAMRLNSAIQLTGPYIMLATGGSPS